MIFKKIFNNPIRVRSFSTCCIQKNVFNQTQLKALRPLQQHAPTFYAHGQHIKPLYQPSEFYSELKARILSAKENIFIAALYIGHTEQELVRIRKSCVKVINPVGIDR